MVMDTAPRLWPRWIPRHSPKPRRHRPNITVVQPTPQQWQRNTKQSAQYAQLRAELTRVKANESRWQQAAQNAQTEQTEFYRLRQANAELTRLNKRWPPPIKPTNSLDPDQRSANPRRPGQCQLAQLERQFRQLKKDLSKATVENKALQASCTSASQATPSQTGPERP